MQDFEQVLKKTTPFQSKSHVRSNLAGLLYIDIDLMNLKKEPWYVIAVLTIVMSIATGVGTYASSYMLLSVKKQEEINRTTTERIAKGAQVHCEKLQLSASLAAEIEFSSDRGYPNRIHISELVEDVAIDSLKKVPDSQIRDEQLALEKRASELVPFLSEEEAQVLHNATLHHYVITQMRTSDVPFDKRTPPSQGGFDGNSVLNEIRNNAAKLASIYRTKCTENP